MRVATFVAVLGLVVSCGIAEMDKQTNAGSDGVWTGPEVGDPMNACYVTALDYRDGYDWRSDQEKGKVKCSLVMFADGIPVLKIPVGDMWQVSSDPMRHRVLDGHLYTDFTDGTITVVKRDGRVLHTYDAAEEVEQAMLHEGQLHTLCRPREGDGFRYRIDGRVVLSRDSGSPMGNMRMSGDTAVFCFSQLISTAQGKKDSYYISKGGKVSKIQTEGDISKVWDMTFHDGEVCMAVSYVKDDGPFLLRGSRKEGVRAIQTQNILTCRFMDSEVLCLNVRCMNDVSLRQSDILWAEGKSWKRYVMDEPLSCSYADEGGFAAAVNPAEGRPGQIFRGNITYRMPEGYCIRGRNPLAARDGELLAGLSSGSDGPPAVWTNGNIEVLPVNGPVTGLVFLQ